jgi:type I restriction enzyme R subunit
MITDINSEDRAVQQTFAEILQNELGWDSEYAWNQETFGADSLLGRIRCGKWCWLAICGLRSTS